MSKILKFPKDFFWGTATSAYQVEGGIENCDWSKFYSAGKACDHYHLYEKDFDLLKKLNQNAYRFSLEWSRIEPKEGKFNQKEIEHYRKFLKALKSRQITPLITLWHFTLPSWLAEKGGWSDKKIIFYFERFAKKVLKEYQNLANFWITLNEPLVYSSMSFLKGKWPPQKKNLFLFLKVIKNQILAHKKIYEFFHKNNSQLKVGIAKNNQYFEPFNFHSKLDKGNCKIIRYFWNEYFLNQIKSHLDFIGLNYYFHHKIKFPFKIKNENKAVSNIGWEIYPQGIYYVLKELYQRYQLPIYITENGLADAQDKLRKNFIKEHLYWIHKAIKEGVDVRGYFHWSLMDNFEWEKGFEPRFGLIKINYKTLKRKLRPSANFYAKISKENSLKI
jgi:beta-glucosidase